MSIQSRNITAVILAGGQGRRMGGQDKGLIEIDGQPIVKILIDKLRKQSIKILINANRNHQLYEGFGELVVEDQLDNYQGPLAGFATAMGAVDTDFILTLPCDSPLLVEDYVERFIAAQDKNKASICVAHDGERLQPVHALIRVDLLDSLHDFLGSGDRKIDHWYARHEPTRVDFTDCADMFANINTPEDRKRMQGRQSPIPMIGFSAFSGTGKTTLLKQLIPLLKHNGLRIAVIKHAHHDFDLDQPGKDSYELRKSGADQTIICTFTRMARITEFENPEQEPQLHQIVAELNPASIDLILVEGYKQVGFDKIELHRSAMRTPLLFPDDRNIIAIACDADVETEIDIPRLDINDIESVADFIYRDFYLPRKRDS